VKNFKFWNYAKDFLIVPTYDVSFSVDDLTLTVNVTNIINARSTFTITLETIGGSILQSHLLVKGETSFSLTQTETLYTTFNYVIKINGTQTHAYEAEYISLIYQTTTYTYTEFTSIPLIGNATAYKISLYGGGGLGGIVTCIITLPPNAIGFKFANTGQVGGGKIGGTAAVLAVVYSDNTAKTIAVAGGQGGEAGYGPGGSAGLIGQNTVGGGCNSNAGGGQGAGPTYNGAGGGAGSNCNDHNATAGSSGITITLPDGITYGQGVYTPNSNYPGAGGGAGWYAGGGGGNGCCMMASGGGGSNFVGRYYNGSSWTPHASTSTFTNGLTDPITGITYWQQTSSNGGSVRDRLIIEVGPEIQAAIQ
jgi:hypothetical protein